MKIKKILLYLIALILFFSGIVYFQTDSNIFNSLLYKRDLQYKQDIINAANNNSYNIENLSSIVGPDELKVFIKKHNNNPEIYNPDNKNIKNKKYRANLHIHTINSDGSLSVEELLDKEQEYAKTLPIGQYMYVAITDHNTVLGSQDIIRVLQKNPNKYNKLKIIPGIEIYTEYKNNIGPEKHIGIHVLTWCINPFNKELEKEFAKKNLSDKWNWQYRDFDELVGMMQYYGIVGIAHPARYTLELKRDKYPYISQMLDRYKEAAKNNKIFFIEGYYQNYPDLGKDHNEYIDYINAQAKEKGIYRTGSTDLHGKNIFSKQFNKKPDKQ